MRLLPKGDDRQGGFDPHSTAAGSRDIVIAADISGSNDVIDTN